MKSAVFISVFFILMSQGINGQKYMPELFCFEDAFLLSPDYSFESQAKLLKNLGFAGIELEGLENADEKLRILDKFNLKVFMVYIQIDIDNEQPYDVRLFDFIKKVRDKGVTLWLHVHSEKYGPSDPGGDKICVPVLQKLADYALEYNVNIALYPHSRFWLEKVGDSMRLTQKINRRNVGAVFNLCHYLKVDKKDMLEAKLTEVIPYLAAVSINGADDGNTNDMDWLSLIKPLGKGSYDVLKVLQILRKNDYKGPVGLQCYNIPGEPSEFLKISVETWNRYMSELSKK
jgi:sugar phosphate isomerase/epimerase